MVEEARNVYWTKSTGVSGLTLYVVRKRSGSGLIRTFGLQDW